ncbi:MAG: methionyl-tRNA formyltransferase [Candidatus Tectomicrobia bacterium]|uniref:Methionyl-tRNA formyltransferase n=1 Tax=Tectimicrobiota bacterium TaxID=2528274 RepID=A0A937W3U4_UNCTE|nr:methionyl-tRNA formyltransferase [Candidatus Tectomicrobia bacterium]
MRIVVHGQQAFGKSVLEALLERGEEVIAVYCAPDPKQGGRPDPLKEAALAHQLPVYQPRSFRNKPEVWEAFAQLQADLCVMAYVTLFVPEEMLYLPTHGTIQYHPSLLPRHRGPSSINWPIIWGETRTGLSIFWPDNGLDTGPILLQKEVDIADTDTLGSLYFDRLYPLGVRAMVEAVDLVRAGQAPKTPQDETLATYEGWCKAENVALDWHKPLQDVWNLIRGADPQPGAWTTYNGTTVQIYDARKLPGPGEGQPGEVTAVSDASMTVATVGGQLEVLRVRAAGGAKISAGAFAKDVGLRPGRQLGG